MTAHGLTGALHNGTERDHALGMAAWIAAFGVWAFVLRDSAPSLDLATAYVELAKPGFIVNDFFTDCLRGRHGRIFFFWLTSWPIRFGLDWYSTLYVFMLANAGALPAALFLGLQRALGGSHTATAITASSVLLAIAYPPSVAWFTVGWWPGYTLHFHPSAFAMTCLFLGCHGLLAAPARSSRQWLFGLLCVFTAALLHPSYALGGVLFIACVCLCGGRPRVTAWLPAAIAVMAALVSFKLSSSSGQLSLAAYDRYFVQLQPEHYLPSRFVPVGAGRWYFPVWVVMGLCGVGLCSALVQRRARFAAMSCGLLTLYAGALLLQYALVERWPLSKTLLLIAPGRYLAYGYWSLVAVAAVATDGVVQLLSGWPAPALRALYQRLTRLGPALLVISVPLAATRGCDRLGRPEDRLSSDDRALIGWLKHNTRAGQVVAAPPTLLRVAVPVLTGRGTYQGDGFPFEDACLAENYARYQNLYGDPTGPLGRSRAAQHYDALTLQALLQLQPPADIAITYAGTEQADATAERVGGYVVHWLRPQH